MVGGYIELNFRPNVQLVSVVRRFVTELYERLLGDPDATSRMALATHELLENAVKYSRDGETTIRIEVMPQGDQHRIIIQLRNRAELAHIHAIREVVDGVARADDAMGFYTALIARKAKERRGSGLGLARICAEGEMQVSYDAQGDVVVIEASAVLGPVPA
jgi:two-component sensor histidine kinase